MKLHPEEEQILLNVDFIQKKRIVTEKIIDDLSGFKDKIVLLIKNLDQGHFITQFKSNYPKISRGENYGGLPYFMLDYPRIFEEENTFAIRTMVYWGNFFSFTIQLSGENQRFFSRRLLADIDQFSNYYCCINNTPWEYHYKEDNYQLINELPRPKLTEILENKPFLKLSVRHHLTDFQNLHSYGLLFYEKIISLLS